MEAKPRGPAQGRDASRCPRAATAPSGTSAAGRVPAPAKALRGAAPWRLALTAETFPSQHVPCRRTVARADEGTQTSPSLEMLLKQQWSLGKKRRKSRDGTHRNGTYRNGSSKEGTHRGGTHRDGTHQYGTHQYGTHQYGTHSQARGQRRASRASCDRDRLPRTPPSSGLSPTEDDGSGAPGVLVTDVPQGRKSKASHGLYADKLGEEEEDQDVLEKEGPPRAGLLSATGRLRAEDLRRALRALGLPASGAELRRALELVPADEHGTLDLHSILGALSRTGAAAAASEAFQPIYEALGKWKQGSLATADLQPALLSLGIRLPRGALPGARGQDDVPKGVTGLGTGAARQAVQDALEPISRIGADSTEASKLRYILQAMDIHPTEQEFEEALQKVAPEKDGTVNLAAFMTALSSIQHSSDLLALEDTVGAASAFETDQLAMRDLLACANHMGIQEGLEKASVEAMQEVLEVIRKVKSNQMEVSQLGEVLANMGIVLPEEELQEALSKVPVTGDEKLKFKEFIKSLTSTGRLSETTWKHVDAGELKTGARMGTHMADQKLQEALEHVAVDGEAFKTASQSLPPASGHVLGSSSLNRLQLPSSISSPALGDRVDIQDQDSMVGSRGAPLTSEELQEALGHTEEDGVAVDDLGSVLDTVGIHLTPEELQEMLSSVSVDGDKVSIQDLNSILGTKGVHLTSKELQEALGHVASTAHTKVNLSESMKAGRAGQKPPLGEEDKVDVNNVGSILASMGIHLTPEELQEAQKHVPVDEGGNISLSAYMRSVMSTRRPSNAEKNRVDIRSLEKILRSAGIHLTDKERQEVLRQVSVDADGRVNLSELMQRVQTVQCTDQGAEKAPSALGRVSKASMLHSLPQKKVLKSILKKTTSREHSRITQRRSKHKTAKNLTKKQLEAFYDAFDFFPKDPDGNINLHGLQETAKELGISLTTQEANKELAFADADRDGKVNFSDFLSTVTDRKCFMQAIIPDKKYRGKGDSAGATGILLFEVLSKLVELAALPQKTLLEIVRYYREKFLSCTGQKAWKDSSSLMYCRKKHHRIRRDHACVSSFVNTARISFMNNKDLLAYVESLKACVPLSASPYAQVPIFPLIPEQEVVITGRPKRDLQKLEKQRRSKPIASFEKHFFQKRNWVQEATAPDVPVECRKQKSSARASVQLLNKPCLTTATLGRIQADTRWMTQQYKQSLALHERARLLRLWRRLRGGRIGLETGSESFHHIFSIYSWSWNVCQELLTPDDLRRADNELYWRAQRRAAARAGK